MPCPECDGTGKVKKGERGDAVSGRELICNTDETLLVGVVMTLTGGAANPSVVRHHIRRIVAEELAKKCQPPSQPSA